MNKKLEKQFEEMGSKGVVDIASAIGFIRTNFISKEEVKEKIEEFDKNKLETGGVKVFMGTVLQDLRDSLNIE